MCLAENCTLMGFYAASSGNFLQTFRDNLSVSYSGFLNLEDMTDRLSVNVGSEVPLLDA